MLNIEDELFSDTQTDYSFSELIAEMERNGTILHQWEQGEPIDNAPTKQKPMNYEKRETIQ